MLVQRYVHNDKNYQLIFQENKYVLEGVLAAKNTKMQTLALQRYRMAE